MNAGTARATRRVVYLHGFASSPASSKAAYFGERLRGRGVDVVCPDLNLPSFRTLTVSRMLADVDRALGEGPAALIGSSLGGMLSVLAAERFGDRVERLVLLAPAVAFAKPSHHLLPPERIAEWKATGALSFFHYAAEREALLDYAFYEDSVRYNAFDAVVAQPMLIFQGRRDASVDPATVEAFAAARPGVRLTLLDDDHQLVTSLPRMWAEAAPFLGLAP